jgi:hypothetical protein
MQAAGSHANSRIMLAMASLARTSCLGWRQIFNAEHDLHTVYLQTAKVQRAQISSDLGEHPSSKCPFSNNHYRQFRISPTSLLLAR